MPVTSIGDMSQSFQSMRQTSDTKTRLYRLSQELSTGQSADLTAKMRGDTTELLSLDRELAVLAGYDQTTSELSRSFARTQMQLGVINDLRNTVASQLVIIKPDSLSTEIQNGVSAARQEFSTAVNLLNGRDGERALFAGRDVAGTALADGEAMLSDMLLAIGAATDVPAIQAAVEQWFDDPAGGFATMGYTGDTGPHISRKISATETLTHDARADDPGAKEVLKGLAMAAVADALGAAVTDSDKAELARIGADTLFAASTPLIQMQARLGDNEERVALAQTAQAAQRTAFSTARNDITVADPYDSAARLQEVQRQLELQFTSMARMSQLSLVNYL